MAMMKRLYDEMQDEVTNIVQESWDNAVSDMESIRVQTVENACDAVYNLGREKGLDPEDVEWLLKGSEHDTVEDFVIDHFDHCWDL